MAKYNNKIVKKICDYVSEGSSNKDSAYMAGVSEETFYAWQRSKSEFSELIKKAEAKRKRHLIKIIYKAAEAQWTAAAWYLERVYPEEFALKREKSNESQYSEAATGENIFEHFLKRAQKEQTKSPRSRKSDDFEVK